MPHLIEAGIPAAPDMDAVAQRYRAFEHALQSGSPATWLPTFREWDDLRRDLDTWSALTHVRFTQNTRNEQARAALEHRDELEPTLTGLDTDMKRRFIVERARLAPQLGDHAFRLWETDLSTFDPIIEADLIAESKLTSEYTQLVAGIQV